MDYKKAVEKIRRERKRVLDEADRLKRYFIENDGEFYALECALRAAEIDAAKGIQTDGESLRRLKEKVYTRLNVGDATFAPPPACKKCGDNGSISGKPCDCAKKTAIADAPQLCAIPLHDFSEFDVGIFPDKDKAKITKIRSDLTMFIEKFDSTPRLNVILMGNSGAGKTFLAGCVANDLLNRGFSVAAMTAFGFVNEMLAYHTTFNDEKLEKLNPLLDCDLLILDDLGTESMLKNVTKEYLYLILNERMLKSKRTLITTNLDDLGLSQRYGERIKSRLFDTKLSFAAMFDTADLRKNKNWK